MYCKKKTPPTKHRNRYDSVDSNFDLKVRVNFKLLIFKTTVTHQDLCTLHEPDVYTRWAGFFRVQFSYFGSPANWIRKTGH